MTKELQRVQAMVILRLREQNPELTEADCIEVGMAVISKLSELSDDELSKIKEIVITAVPSSEQVH